MKALLLFMSINLLCVNYLYAMQIDNGACYSIDGPANVRDKPNEAIIDRLPSGKTVLVKDSQDVWYLIEYSSSDKFTCPPKDNLKTAWTHEGNLLAYDLSLEDLIKKGRILIAQKKLDSFGDDRGTILGEELKFVGDKYERQDMFGLAVPKIPLTVNIYCLDGNKAEAVIKSIEYDMGGDSGVRLIKINTKEKFPRDNCIFVNGVIKKRLNSEKVNNMPPKIDACPPPKNQFSFCRYQIGDFNNDGTFQVILNEGKNGAPYISRWKLFEIDDSGLLKLLGPIGSYITP
jgi:hypothetical protein